MVGQLGVIRFSVLVLGVLNGVMLEMGVGFQWATSLDLLMTELSKYFIAVVFLFFFIGGIALLTQLIPLWISRALPL